ncbi:N-lysine methyltransferase KMT5A-A-like [Chaetodon auriga]|uniref:N-lysine methyltransferase KMT5A-A-like n=1 Tax=Chaetodon auriga TaxID=39042 RepID=UPI00403309A1
MTSKRKARIKPVEDAISHILSGGDKPSFAERFINNIKGRGVFATEPVVQGSFVLEYRGAFLSAEECRSRKYSEKQSTFLYEFDWQKRQWCIDASKEDGSLGRLVNDNHRSPNCVMKKVIVNNRPHLCLFAVKNIEVGTELEYNYGDSKWPWRQKVTSKQAPAAEEEMAVPPVNLSSKVDADDEKTGDGPKVTSKQAPAAEEEIAVPPVNLSSKVDADDEKTDDGPKDNTSQHPN